MYCIFNKDTGCLISLYATREPDPDSEVKLEYTGDLPGPSETLRLVDGDIVIVDDSECQNEPDSSSLNSFSKTDHYGIYVYRKNDFNVPCKRTAIIPFDTVEVKRDSPDDNISFDFNPNNGSITVPPGMYFINIAVLMYSNYNKLLKCVSVLNNGEEVARRFVSSYKFRLNTINLTAAVPLTAEKNVLMVYIDDIAKTSMAQYIRWYGRGVKIIGGAHDTFFYMVQL